MVARRVRQVVAHGRYILTTNRPCQKNWSYMTGGRKKGCRKTQVLLYRPFREQNGACMVIRTCKSICACKSHRCLNWSIMTRKYHENKSFYLIHHVSKVIVYTLAVNQNTLKTTAKEKFTNNAIYSSSLLSASEGLWSESRKISEYSELSVVFALFSTHWLLPSSDSNSTVPNLR